MRLYILILILLMLTLLFVTNMGEKDIENITTPDKVIKKSSSSKENNITTTPKKSKEDKISSSTLIVEVNSTIDTLMENNLSIPLVIKNASNELLVTWTIDKKELIYTDKPYLTHSFSLGEHPIEIKIYNKNSLLWDKNITIRAWRYLKKEKYYYSRDKEEYELYITRFLDHQKRLVLEFNEYFKKELTYNEFGKLIEERYESFDTPQMSYTITYSYDEDRLLSMEKIDSEGEIIESHIYDENGKEIIKENSKKESKREGSIAKSKKFYNKDGNLTKVISPNGKYIITYKYNKNGQIVSVHRVHPYGEGVTNRTYDENGRLLTYDSKYSDKDGNQRNRYWYRYDYDDDGNKIKKETKQYGKERLLRHIVEKWHYKNGKVQVHETEALVGYCPCTMDTIRSKTTYKYDKSGKEISSQYEYQRENDSEMMQQKEPKEIVSYTNTLE